MAGARAIFSFFLISPFSKGRHRGICFYFSSLPTNLWDRVREMGRLHSSLLLRSFTLSLIPLPSKGEGKST